MKAIEDEEDVNNNSNNNPESYIKYCLVVLINMSYNICEEYCTHVLQMFYQTCDDRKL